MELSRRDFLKVSGASAAGAVVFAGCSVNPKEMLLESPVNLPEDTLTSFENWYASVCRQCSAGCGIVVRVVEGRAKKIEGNPDFPLNRGKLCPRGIAGVQALYHPDRVRSPLRRTGPRGSGKYTVVSWDDALDELTSRMKALKEAKQEGSVVLAAEPGRGLSATIAKRFMTNYGGGIYGYEPLETTVVRRASEAAYGDGSPAGALLPHFDIENSTYVLSFGANFLEPWLSQVNYNRQYGEFRQGGAERGTLVQFEQRMSTTGANADEWVYLKPGTDGVLAMAIASHLVSRNLVPAAAVNAATGGRGAAAFNGFDPASAEKVTGVPAARIQALAEAFAKAKAPLAIGGNGAAAHTNGSFSLQAILMLNYLVGSVGRRGGVLLNPAGSVREFTDLIAADPLRAWRNLADRMRNGEVNILMVHNANPLYGLPPAVQFGQALAKVPVIVSFSSFMDETTAMADLILPDSNYLESWDGYMPEPGVGYEAVAFQQPVVMPVYSTRAFGDTLLAASKALGEDMKPGLAWESMKDAIKVLSQPMHQANRGSIRATESGKPVAFDAWWNRVLAAGGFWDERATRQGALPTGKAFPTQAVEAKFSGDEKSFPFSLVLFPGVGIGDGSMAHLPWLQMTPDPMTTVAWQTWIELNPKDCEEMKLRTGDIVRVESPKGALETVVYEYPAIAPGTVAMPTGQGHNYMGRYAEKRGANPLTIVDPELIDPATGALAFNATRVKITKTGRRYNLPRIEGGAYKKVEQPDDYAVVQVTDGKGGETHAAGAH